MAMLLTAATAVILLLSTQASSAQAACVGGVFCTWTGTFYTGSEVNAGCGGATFSFVELKSAKNHCSVNVHIGWLEGGTTNWKACMSPGGERPDPGRFNNIQPSGC